LQISTLELSSSDLFVGTSQGRLLHFLVQEHRDELGRLRLEGILLGQESVGGGCIAYVRAATALQRLLVFCKPVESERERGGGLHILASPDLSPLTPAGAAKLKTGVHACCVNENPQTDDPFSVQVCLAKRKQIAVISLTEAKLSVDKIISDVSERVSAVAMDGNFICAAFETHYVVYDVPTGAKQDLFPVEGAPAIARVAKEEFLLSAPGDLGMFVTSAGVSERPPIQWAKPTDMLAFTPPYVLAAGQDGIAVYR